jgi:hypothetical protein
VGRQIVQDAQHAQPFALAETAHPVIVFGDTLRTTSLCIVMRVDACNREMVAWSSVNVTFVVAMR